MYHFNSPFSLFCINVRLFILSGLPSIIKEYIIFVVDFGGFGRDESAKLVLEAQKFLQQLPSPSI